MRLPRILVLVSWVTPYGARSGIRKGGEGAVRLPRILVLISSAISQCTDFWPKTLATASTLEAGVCGTTAMATARQCYDAAASLGLSAKTNASVSSAASPAGCYATARRALLRSWVVLQEPSLPDSNMRRSAC